MRHAIMLSVACIVLPACANLPLEEPATLGEKNAGFNYIPVDPLPVNILLGPGIVDANGEFPEGTTAEQMRVARFKRCVGRKEGEPLKVDVMDALPDNTIRKAVRETSGDVRGGFGPVSVGARGTSYQVVVDSIIADTTNVPFAIRIGNGATSLSRLPKTLPSDIDIKVIRLNADPKSPTGYSPIPPDDFEVVSIPVYVGVGLRLTANIRVEQASVNLANLAAVAASVEASRNYGSLTMQTLGIFGPQVASTFPIPSELNTTAVQNALVSLGAVKAIVYDRDTGTRPRLTGIYNPLPTSDPELINKIYSALAREPINWAPCGSS